MKNTGPQTNSYFTLHYKVKGGLRNKLKDHRARQATQATIQCPDKIAETDESSVFVGVRDVTVSNI